MMRVRTKRTLQPILLMLFAALFATNTWTADKVTPAEARKIAKDAYIFNYPLVMMYRTMYLQAIDKTSKSYSGGFGKWLHLGTSSPKDTDIVSPNNDSPYSYSWVDTRAEPWILTMPKIEKKRFYTSQWDDLWGFVLDNPGSVEDGNDGVSLSQWVAAPRFSSPTNVSIGSFMLPNVDCRVFAKIRPVIRSSPQFY